MKEMITMTFFIKTVFVFASAFLLAILILVLVGGLEYMSGLSSLTLVSFYSLGLPCMILGYYVLNKCYCSVSNYIISVFFWMIFGGILALPFVNLNRRYLLSKTNDMDYMGFWGSAFLFPFLIIPGSVLIYILGRKIHFALWNNENELVNLDKYRKRYLIILSEYFILNIIVIFFCRM